MKREFNSELNRMQALMERMDMHMTGDNARNYTLLREDGVINSQGKSNGKLKPIVQVENAIDVESKKRQIVLKIGVLAPQTTMKIKQTSPYKNDRMRCRTSVDKKYVIISKEVPWQTRKKRDKKDDSDDNASQTNQQQPSGNGFFMNAFNNSNYFMNAFNNLNGGNNASQQQTQPDPQQASSSKKVSDIMNNGFANPDDANAIIDDWLNNYYKGIVDIIAQEGIYDQQYVQDLYDINSIKANIVSKSSSPKQTKFYVEQSDSEIIDEIANALKNGNYAQVISGQQAPLNLEGAIWGNILSSANIKRIQNQAANVYGLNPNDPDYPTMVMGAIPWYKNYHRVVRPNARTYHMAANHNGSSQHGAQGSYETVNKYGAGYGAGHMLGIDISDTDPIDPNDDWYETRLGLKNNLTGELNQMVIDALNKVKDQIPEELVQQATNITSDKGKAKIYNEAIDAYNQEQKLGITIQNIPDTADDATAVGIYAKNLDQIADNFAAKYGFAKGGPNYGKIKDCFCFAIAHYTVGEHLFGNYASQHGNNLNADWKTFAEQIVSGVRRITSFIKIHVFDIFSPLRDEVEKLFSQVLEQGDNNTNTESEDAAQTQAPVNESVDYDMNKLLNELNLWIK